MKFSKKNLSPVAIAKELQDAVASLPEGEAWEDYFAGGAGRTIIELIAGSQAIKNHYNLMRVRESTLQYAKLDSSVTELAINKGVYRPPAKSYIIEITFQSYGSGWLNRGEVIGSYKNYDVIVMEKTEFIFGHANKVKVTIGALQKYEKVVLDATEFYQIDIPANHLYISGEFQELSLALEDGTSDNIDLIDEELNLYDDKLKTSCLRLTFENFTRLIFGDGVIGKLLEINDEVNFSFISFGPDLLENFALSSMSLDKLVQASEVTNYDVIRKPTKYIDKEILRKIAIRNSVDGRWVQTQDYENGILREFSEYIYDILVKDEYPAENITILPREDYVTPEVKEEINTLINNKRGNATLINTVYLDPHSDQRLTLSYGMHYVGTDTDEFLRGIIDVYKKGKENKIHYTGYFLACADIAVDLTHLAPGGKFYATLEENVFIEPLNSIKKLNLNYTR